MSWSALGDEIAQCSLLPENHKMEAKSFQRRLLKLRSPASPCCAFASPHLPGPRHVPRILSQSESIMSAPSSELHPQSVQFLRVVRHLTMNNMVQAHQLIFLLDFCNSNSPKLLCSGITGRLRSQCFFQKPGFCASRGESLFDARKVVRGGHKGTLCWLPCQ